MNDTDFEKKYGLSFQKLNQITEESANTCTDDTEAVENMTFLQKYQYILTKMQEKGVT